MVTARRRTLGPGRDGPLADPIPRRRALLVLGSGTLAATGGLSALASLLAACAAPPPVTVTLDVDPGTLEPGVPSEVEFTLPRPDGGGVAASVWLVRLAGDDVVAFDPRCTHALCTYAWSDEVSRFLCHCHQASFALDGTVLEGPPPRALDRWPARVVGDRLEVDVPGGFSPPGESLPA